MPNLFARDEAVSILEGVTPRAKKAAAAGNASSGGGGARAGSSALTPAALWAFFVKSCRCTTCLCMVHACEPTLHVPKGARIPSISFNTACSTNGTFVSAT